MIKDIVPLYRDTDTLIDEWEASAPYDQHHTATRFQSRRSKLA
jgi:hypothetical protein